MPFATPLSQPRSRNASVPPPGDIAFWHMMLDQSDNFSFKTARDGKGGPFGAQLWLVDPASGEYVLVGGAGGAYEDSNAVIAKGIASAHAEAENLSKNNKNRIRDFLRTRAHQGWKIVQVSSAESCQSCRAKQIAFALELAAAKLIAPGDFHVVFKATYEQTRRFAGFNDAPYDTALRAIAACGALDHADGLAAIEALFAGHGEISALIAAGDLIYAPVSRNGREMFSSRVGAWPGAARGGNDSVPYAVIAGQDGTLLSAAIQHSREENVIISALHAAAKARRAGGVHESWDLAGAEIYTNIVDIGPLAYAECLWSNIARIHIVGEDANARVDHNAREIESLENRDFFRLVAADYNLPDAPISVFFAGDPKMANIAHRYWEVHIAREEMLARQQQRIRSFGDRKIALLDGGDLPLSAMVEGSNRTSQYNGTASGAHARAAPEKKIDSRYGSRMKMAIAAVRTSLRLKK